MCGGALDGRGGRAIRDIVPIREIKVWNIFQILRNFFCRRYMRLCVFLFSRTYTSICVRDIYLYI